LLCSKLQVAIIKVLIFTEEVRGVPLGYDLSLIHAVIDLGVDPCRRVITRIINYPAGTLKRGDEAQLAVFEVPPIPIEKGEAVTIMAERVFFAFEPAKK
jgi:uncharacterized protein